MFKLYFLHLLLVAVGLTSAQTQYQSKASLHANKGGIGVFTNLPTTTYSNDLSSFNFNNRAYSVCLTGAWLFYDLTNFNANTDASMEYLFEPSLKCIDFANLGGHVSSVKYVGDPKNYRAETITFYENVYFQGKEEYVTGDLSNLNLKQSISSLIITGQTAWTVYDQPSYSGQGICLTPNQTPNYTPAFISDTLDVVPAIPHGTIASVRKGCHSSKIVSFTASANSIKHIG